MERPGPLMAFEEESGLNGVASDVQGRHGGGDAGFKVGGGTLGFKGTREIKVASGGDWGVGGVLVG